AATIGGQPGYWFVSADPSDTILKLQGADLVLLPAVQTIGIVRIGGDNITVNGTGETISGNFTVSAPVFNGQTPDPVGTTDRLTRSDGHTWNGIGGGEGAHPAGPENPGASRDTRPTPGGSGAPPRR